MRLDRQQAERVLGRAASLALRRSDSVSLTDLEQAAQEAGLDGALVRQAMVEMEAERGATPRRYGMETRIVRRRLIGRRLLTSDLERLFGRLDAYFGARGERRAGKETGTWFARHIQVTFEPHRDGTLIQVSERFVNTASAMGSFGMLLGGASGFLAASAFWVAAGLGSGGLAVAVPAAFLSGWLGLAFVRRRHAQTLRETGAEFERALDSLERSMHALPAAE